jgi:hypothetical protein
MFCGKCGAKFEAPPVAAPQQMEAKFCPSCGVKNEAAVKFCQSCGGTFADPQALAQAPVRPQPMGQPQGYPPPYPPPPYPYPYPPPMKKKSNPDKWFIIFTAVIVGCFYLLPYYAIVNVGRPNTWYSGFGTIMGDVASFPALLAFIIPIVICAFVLLKKMFATVADGKLAVLFQMRYLVYAGLSVLAILFNITFMNRINAHYFGRWGVATTVQAGPVFFLSMILYVIMIILSIMAFVSEKNAKAKPPAV